MTPKNHEQAVQNLHFPPKNRNPPGKVGPHFLQNGVQIVNLHVLITNVHVYIDHCHKQTYR